LQNRVPGAFTPYSLVGLQTLLLKDVSLSHNKLHFVTNRRTDRQTDKQHYHENVSTNRLIKTAKEPKIAEKCQVIKQKCLELRVKC